MNGRNFTNQFMMMGTMWDDWKEMRRILVEITVGCANDWNDMHGASSIIFSSTDTSESPYIGQVLEVSTHWHAVTPTTEYDSSLK
jgi:hypothetical protein